ncbi:MAG TPA: cytochrome c peroxidase [Planctomycetota bacterium]|nr:cytochrome c peroxidase [Planctomycetota bacterium]
MQSRLDSSGREYWDSLRSITSCAVLTLIAGAAASAQSTPSLNAQLQQVLLLQGFTGAIESTLETRLGRPLDPNKADLGRLLFFDNALGLHKDNSCAGCHSPAFGFGDSQPMAIGVDNNGKVGKSRSGARNQRRSPLVANTEFYPSLMWTARFTALSGDPFDNSAGFQFPPPENIINTTQTLLQAQGSLPSTELVEMAGFTGIIANPGPFGPAHYQFDNGAGDALPPPVGGFHNFPIQDLIDARLNSIPEYVALFSLAFNGGVMLPPGGITIHMRRLAIAEFQMSLPGADAPIDRFARGQHNAMSTEQKRGALLFFGQAGCVACHAVGGQSNEMFSDFQLHRIGGPQLFPSFGVGLGNVIFDGPGASEDFGVEQTSGNPAQRYMFRTAPLRNLAVAPAFFHNGAFGSIEAAIKHHLDVAHSLAHYDAHENKVPDDLAVGPVQAMLALGIDPLLATPISLNNQQVRDLTAFVKEALLDDRVLDFCDLVPHEVPSGLPVAKFQGCR